MGLFQRQVAELIEVTSDSITNWENNKAQPSVHNYPKIIDFLGYFPFDIDTRTLPGRIKLYRYTYGLSQEALAKRLNIDESTVLQYEKGKHKPNAKTTKKIEKLFV